VNQQESVWVPLLFVATSWAAISAMAASASVHYEMRRSAFGWFASFLVSSLVAAYCFWRLP
jgi:hypothetical protein